MGRGVETAGRATFSGGEGRVMGDDLGLFLFLVAILGFIWLTK